MKERILFVDMDGVLADFDGGLNGGEINQMFENKFFLNLLPLEENLSTTFEQLQKLIKVKILSKACVRGTDKRFTGQEQDKIDWIKKYIPSMAENDIIIQSTEQSKGEIVELYKEYECLLIDDYSKNLAEWELAGGLGIKKAKRIKDRPWEQVSNIKDLLNLLENVL